MAKITYEDKEFLNKNESIADKNKVNDTDLNQIKEVVNGNDDKIGNLSDLNTTDKSSIVGAINDIKKKNILTAEMSQESLTIVEGNQEIPLKLGQLFGSEISLANNTITISNNINKVKVSATFNVQMPSAGNVYGQLTVKGLDGKIMATSANSSNVGQYNFFEMNITPKIIDVSTVKTICLDAYLSRQGTAHNDEYGNCYITVEAVE